MIQELNSKIAKFVNSPDILEYWVENNYLESFTALQLSYIVYNSKNATLSEKHKMWREIIDNCDDMIIDGRFHHGKSLFHLMKSYMSFQCRQVEEFYKNELGTCYTVRYEEPGAQHFYDCSTIYSSPEKALSEELDEDTIYLRVTKEYLDKSDYVSVTFRADKEVMSIFSVGAAYDAEDVVDLFDDFYYSFPLPFRKGDIVTDNQEYLTYKCSTEVFVIDKILDWDKDYRAKHLKSGDASDMIAYCYQQYGDEGKIIYDHRHNLLDYSYYRGEVSGSLRTLKTVSSYMKGEIGLELLMIAYRQIVMEELTKRNREDISWFVPEALHASGME